MRLDTFVHAFGDKDNMTPNNVVDETKQERFIQNQRLCNMKYTS